VLFRRFADRSGTGAARFTVPFDPENPVGTPRGLARTPEVANALFGAVDDLVTNGIPLDATMRGYQYRLVGDERIPLPGGGGVFQALNTTSFMGADGWQGTGGSSFVYWVELTPKGPVGKQIQVQGQSSNSTSPLHTAQTRMYSEGKYLDILFTEQQIKSDPNLSVKVLRSSPGGKP
jgi:acyl-homoserine-lactone acylase